MLSIVAKGTQDRITMLRHPLLDAAAARIVARKGQNEGAAIIP